MSFWSERILIGVATLLSAQVTMWAGLKDSDCLECHSDKTLTRTNAAGKEILLFVDPAKLAASAHKTNTCASCHADLTEKHPDDNVAAKPVNCLREGPPTLTSI